LPLLLPLPTPLPSPTTSPQETLHIASGSNPQNLKLRKADAAGVSLNPILQEYRQDPRRSKLKRIVPTVGSFFTPLRLVDAFHEYDAVFSLSRRKYIHPNFAELRHILNLAQIHASADSLKLITFDADGTLYADGHHIEQDSQMIRLMLQLMKSNVHVAIVTAAGYPNDAKKFEARVRGLLDTFKKHKMPASITNRCEGERYQGGRRWPGGSSGAAVSGNMVVKLRYLICHSTVAVDPAPQAAMGYKDVE
jgi:hypothetical protein